MEVNDSASSEMARRLTRRGFVEFCLLSAVASRIAGCSALPAGAQLDRFIAVCAELTGVPADVLDSVVAERLMEAFTAVGRSPGIARLLAGETDPTDDELPEDLIVAWYSGYHPVQPGDPGGDSAPARTEVVGTYENALIWTALDFARPQGVCGGAQGHWSRPPGA